MTPSQVWVYLLLFISSGEKDHLLEVLSHLFIPEPITVARGWDLVIGLNQSGPTWS